MSTCLSCINWRLQAGPKWAARIGMAPCAVKNTNAVTLSHWHACTAWRPLPADQVQARTQWLTARGLTTTPRSGSFPITPTAGHSRREGGLFHGAAKGVDLT